MNAAAKSAVSRWWSAVSNGLPIARRGSQGNQFYYLHASRMREITRMGWEDMPADELALIYFRLNVVPLRRLFSWAVPCEEALTAIASSSAHGVVEIGAGTGYWAWLLRQRNVEVVAFDRHPVTHPDLNGYHGLPAGILSSAVRVTGRGGNRVGNAPPFTAVQEGGPEVAGEYPDQSLLICWPPAEDDSGGSAIANMALDTLQAYQGRTVIYVGQVSSQGDCGNGQPAEMQTAGPKFLSALRENWERTSLVPLPSWPRAPACLTIWSRKKFLPTGGPVRGLTGSNNRQGLETETADSFRLRREILEMYDMLWKDAVFAHFLGHGRLGQLSSNERWLLMQCMKKGVARFRLLSPLARIFEPVA